MTEATTHTPISLTDLRAMKSRGEKIACLTVYDASFTRVLEAAGVDMFIVGDSLGMVLMGYDSTVPVTMDDMIHHAANVARAGQRAYRVVDLPYQSYATAEQALDNARRLLTEGGAHMVKLEGGTAKAAVVAHLVGQGIPVCGHIGLLPQSVTQPDGYRVQGRDAATAQAIMDDARALQAAGAGLLVIECVPAALTARITATLDIPAIGIGAGPDCDGQVLVLHDMLGITMGAQPKFVQDFLAESGSIRAAIETYVRAVKDGTYPQAQHCY